MDVRRLARNAALSQAMRAWHQKTQTTRDGRLLWSERENDILRKHYPDFRKLYELLPHRTIGAIDNQCARLELVTKRTLLDQSRILEIKKDVWICQQGSIRVYQALFSDHFLPSCSRALAIMTSLRMMAVRATCRLFCCD